jgi:hypothetical protein
MDSKFLKLYEKIINSDKDVVLFGLSRCELSRKILEILKKKKITYKYYIIDEYYNIFFILFKKLANEYPELNISNCELTNFKSTPIIFIKKKYIGNYIQFIDYYKKLNHK